MASLSNFLENRFKLSAQGTDTKTEIIGGLTTFMTMAYILVVNPMILSKTGMDASALVTATALSAIIGTLFMALVANLPFALAPGMGLNAFFTFTVCLGMGKPWEFALTAVFIEGIIFIILTAFNIREALVNAIPQPIKLAITCGIGLFIALIGFYNAGMGGLVAQGTGIPVTLGDLAHPNAILIMLGVLIGGVLLVRKVPGALMLTIIICTVIGIPLGITKLPGASLANWWSMPPSLTPIAFKFQWNQVLSFEMALVVITFLFVDMFDTIGMLIGGATRAGMLDENGQVPRIKQALFADAIGTTVGALLGTSTVTTYAESAAGIASGARTGLSSVVVAVMFAISLFLAPLFLMVPGAATAPILILVGVFMMAPVVKIDFEEFSDAIPCFLTIVMMPFTYSVAEGIAFGLISWVIIKLATGKKSDVNWILVAISVLLILKYIML